VAVVQDYSGQAWPRLLAVAGAIGALRGGALELTPQQETELALFMQQALLPALHNLILTAADLLVREGYPPEAALLDIYASGGLAGSLAEAAQKGMMQTLSDQSLTEQYGVLTRTERFQDPKIRRQMEVILDEIRAGKFAQEWANEYHNGAPRLAALRKKRGELPLWRLEAAAIRLAKRARGEFEQAEGKPGDGDGAGEP
jgi:ketol-acid reductoisomerase